MNTSRRCQVTGLSLRDCDCGACDDEPDGDEPDEETPDDAA